MELYEEEKYLTICQGGNTANWVKRVAAGCLGVNPDNVATSNAKDIKASAEEEDEVLRLAQGRVVGVFNRAEEKIPEVIEKIRETAKAVHIGTEFFDHFG